MISGSLKLHRSWRFSTFSCASVSSSFAPLKRITPVTFPVGTVAVYRHVLLVTLLSGPWKSWTLALALALNKPPDHFTQHRRQNPPEAPKHLTLLGVFRDKSFIFTSVNTLNSLRYWVHSPRFTRMRHKLLFWWSCRSLSAQFKTFSVEGWATLTLTDKQAVDLEVIHVKVALDTIIPLIVTIWTWNQVWLPGPAWSWAAATEHETTVLLEASSACRVLLSPGSVSRASALSHWLTNVSFMTAGR